MQLFLRILTLVLSATVSQTALGVETSYLRFQEPNGWACQQEQTLWICRSKDPIEMKESFLVVRAKLAGRTDNMHSFYESLKNPLPLINATGNEALSKVYSVEKISLANKDWIKAVHLNSISQNYFTEYLVTIVGDLAIGIELNYHQARYKKYKDTLKQITNSLSLVDNIASNTSQTLQNNSDQTKPAHTNIPGWLNKPEDLTPNKKHLIYFVTGLAVIISFLFFRIKK